MYFAPHSGDGIERYAWLLSACRRRTDVAYGIKNQAEGLEKELLHLWEYFSTCRTLVPLAAMVADLWCLKFAAHRPNYRVQHDDSGGEYPFAITREHCGQTTGS